MVPLSLRENDLMIFWMSVARQYRIGQNRCHCQVRGRNQRATTDTTRIDAITRPGLFGDRNRTTGNALRADADWLLRKSLYNFFLRGAKFPKKTENHTHHVVIPQTTKSKLCGKYQEESFFLLCGRSITECQERKPCRTREADECQTLPTSPDRKTHIEN